MNPQDETQKSTFKAEVLTQRGKKRSPSTRAMRRAKTMALIKQVESLMAMLGPHKQEAVRALVDGLKATRKIYHQGVCVDEVPDELARHKNAVAILEWLEGKPRELQVSIHGDFEDLASLQQRVAQSPAFKQLTESSQKTVEKG
jgi:hypothetical protein